MTNCVALPGCRPGRRSRPGAWMRPSRSSDSRPCRWRPARTSRRRSRAAARATHSVPRRCCAPPARRCLLHQRHVLVGRGVEHDAAAVAREHLLDARACLTSPTTAATGTAGKAIARTPARSRRARPRRCRTARARRREARDLAAQLRADRAAGAGDHHDACRRATRAGPRCRARPGRGRAGRRARRADRGHADRPATRSSYDGTVSASMPACAQSSARAGAAVRRPASR